MKPLSLSERIKLSNEAATDAYYRRVSDADRISNSKGIAREFYADFDYRHYRNMLRILAEIFILIGAAGCLWLILDWFKGWK